MTEPRHEFVPDTTKHYKTCVLNVGDGMDYYTCGQPQSADIHQPEPRQIGNPHADDLCALDCPFDLPPNHRIKDHPRLPEPRQPPEAPEQIGCPDPEINILSNADLAAALMNELWSVESLGTRKSHLLEEAIDRLRIEYRRADSPTEAWQPIESAPKDGTKVLIFVSSDDDGECHKIAYWSNLAARPGWFYRGGWLEENEPDGWMPLPASPQH